MKVSGQGFDLLLNPPTSSSAAELPNEQLDSVLELPFDFLMGAAEKIAHWRLKQHFIREKRLQIGRLLEPLMPGDARAAF